MSTANRVLEEQLSPDEVARRLGVSVSTVWAYVRQYRETKGKDGIGPARKLSHRVTRIPASAVNRFLEGREV